MITYYVFAGLCVLCLIGIAAFIVTEIRESRYWDHQRSINEENL